MKNQNIIIACSKQWFFKSSKNIIEFTKNKNVFLIKKKQQLNFKNIKKINPKFIFFPHWSFKVPDNIINNFQCICFHTSPLPYGRGGSPIQNLIKKKIKYSPVCAIKMKKKLDAGPIYLKKKISLSGNLNEILKRMSTVIFVMIKQLLDKKIIPKPQIGRKFYFKRLTYLQNELNFNKNLKEIYDQIRMLDAPDYKKAYMNVKNKYKLELCNAKIKNNSVLFDGKIFKS